MHIYLIYSKWYKGCSLKVEFWKSSFPILEECGIHCKKVLPMLSHRGSSRGLELVWLWEDRGELLCPAEGVTLWASQWPMSLSAGAVCQIPAPAVPGYTCKRGLPAWGRQGVGREPQLQSLCLWLLWWDPSLLSTPRITVCWPSCGTLWHHPSVGRWPR